MALLDLWPPHLWNQWLLFPATQSVVLLTATLGNAHSPSRGLPLPPVLHHVTFLLDTCQWLLQTAGTAPRVLMASPIQPAPVESRLLPFSLSLTAPHLILGTQQSLWPKDIIFLMPISNPVTDSISSTSKMCSQFASTTTKILSL